MYPHERSLVEKFKDRPFVILGVNSDDDREQLKQVLVKEEADVAVVLGRRLDRRADFPPLERDRLADAVPDRPHRHHRPNGSQRRGANRAEGQGGGEGREEMTEWTIWGRYSHLIGGEVVTESSRALVHRP